MPVLILFAGFTINLALLELRKTELFVAADAAARAGGRELGVTQSSDQAIARAKEFAAYNTVGGTPAVVKDEDIVLGYSQRQGVGRYSFQPSSTRHNAMRVTVRRDDQHPDGPISLLFPMPNSISSVALSQSSVSTQVEVDIALVLDRSGSMAYASDEVASYPPAPRAAPPGWDFCDPAPPKSRWLDLVSAVQTFNNELSNSPTLELAALVTYADTPAIELPLTSNYSLIDAAVDKYTRRFCSGGTNIGGGILAGLSILATSPQKRNGAIKVIILMTDGKHNTGTHPLSAATIAARQGVMIFTITFANEADQALMQQVAQRTKGDHYHATNGQQLRQVFQDIARRLPVLLTE